MYKIIKCLLWSLSIYIYIYISDSSFICHLQSLSLVLSHRQYIFFLTCMSLVLVFLLCLCPSESLLTDRNSSRCDGTCSQYNCINAAEGKMAQVPSMIASMLLGARWHRFPVWLHQCCRGQAVRSVMAQVPSMIASMLLGERWHRFPVWLHQCC